MNGRLCDAHLHFNCSSGDPVADLLSYRQRMGIDKGVLILNTKREYELWLQASQFQGFIESYTPIFGLHKDDTFARQIAEEWNNKGLPLRIKLHPRLNAMCLTDDEWYIDWLCDHKPVVVVVDDFPYGDMVAAGYVPNLICRLAGLLTSSNIIMAHAGGAELLSHVMRSKTYANVFYDISLTANYLIDSSVRQDLKWLLKFHANRVMLGSDYPDFDFQSAQLEVEKIFEEISLPMEKRQQIMWQNANEVYQLGMQGEK